MTVQEVLKAIELDEKVREAERRGARSYESEASRVGREALELVSRREVRERVQSGRFQLRGVAR